MGKEKVFLSTPFPELWECNSSHHAPPFPEEGLYFLGNLVQLHIGFNVFFQLTAFISLKPHSFFTASEGQNSCRKSQKKQNLINQFQGRKDACHIMKPPEKQRQGRPLSKAPSVWCREQTRSASDGIMNVCEWGGFLKVDVQIHFFIKHRSARQKGQMVSVKQCRTFIFEVMPRICFRKRNRDAFNTVTQLFNTNVKSSSRYISFKFWMALCLSPQYPIYCFIPKGKRTELAFIAMSQTFWWLKRSAQ